MKKVIGLWFLVLLFASAAGMADDLPVVPHVDFQRYAGRWYEILRLPNRFQEVCSADVSALYTPQEDGNIAVLNQCRKQDGAMTVANGVARLAIGASQPGKLEVRFAPAWLGFLPFVWGNYWIIDLADDYSTSLVGSPDRQFLWLLARTPQLDPIKQNTLIDKARRLGFATERLIITTQHP